ncbi:MAG TPA: hypothetical protein VK756_00035 [Solirubrobacteraceae bacterium]|jgi:hypothetical protein|nr:hypothetical protein [Solirubrobacteraceae bacterium]
MRRALLWLIATAGISVVSAGLPAPSLAASPPTIGNSWVSGVTQSDATLQAEVNPEDPGVGVYYQFQVVANASEFQSEIACPPRADLKGADGCGPGPEVAGALPIGFIEHGTETRTARVDLADAGMTLQPDTTYRYRLLAARTVPTEDTIQWEPPALIGTEGTFTTLATGPAPKVESESVSHITSKDATLEAQINPEGRETTYEFDLEAPSCLSRGIAGCETAGGVSIYRGTLPAGSTAKTVSVDVDSAWYGRNLLPSTLYGYRVVARSASGAGTGRYETFMTTSGLSPVIGSVSISHLTPTDATLEAQIDSEGLPTEYQFHLISSPCSEHGFGCELIVPIPLPRGNLLGSFVVQTVSLDLNSVGVKLGEGEYHYSVSATSEGGSTYADGQTFEAPPGVIDPPGPATAPQAGGDQPTTSSNGDRTAGSGVSSGSATTSPGQAPNAPGVSKTGAPKHGAGGRHKTKHAHRHKKPVQHRAQAKEHKR